jgi:hypothetical protein
MRSVIMHRLIFSMSKEQYDALVAVGINPNHALHSSLKKVMRKFAEKIHPGDSIGFAYGLHHDRGTFTRPSRVVSAHSQRPLRGFTAKRNANLFRR